MRRQEEQAARHEQDMVRRDHEEARQAAERQRPKAARLGAERQQTEKYRLDAEKRMKVEELVAALHKDREECAVLEQIIAEEQRV